MKLETINYRQLGIELSQAFGIALLLSLFIYMEHFDLTLYAVNTVAALLGFYFLLSSKGRVVIFSGGFIGLLWFYWIGYSFEYYNVGWMLPFITLFFILLYAFFFGLLAFTNNPLYRGMMLFGLSYVEPMDWNWLQLELPFVNSYFGIEKWQFALIIAVLALFVYLSKKKHPSPYRFGLFFLLLLSVEYSHPQLTPPDVKIKLYAPQLLQAEKWKHTNQQQIVSQNLHVIQDAASKGYDLIVLPESAFPLYLNKNGALVQRLQMLSHQIDIITGALYVEDGLHYNVSYHFSKGHIKIAKKMVLVPFGEYVPLPDFLKKWVNETFFDGSADFVTATKPTDFLIKGVSFRNAVCYEATCNEIYEGEPTYMIAISNNGWFYPSIEPTLQKLLMKFYAKKHNTIIYHSANMGGAGVVNLHN